MPAGNFSGQARFKRATLNDNFHGAGKSSTDLSLGMKRCRIPGGVVGQWNKGLDSVVNVLRISVDWCIARHFAPIALDIQMQLA